MTKYPTERARIRQDKRRHAQMILLLLAVTIAALAVNQYYWLTYGILP